MSAAESISTLWTSGVAEQRFLRKVKNMSNEKVVRPDDDPNNLVSVPELDPDPSPVEKELPPPTFPDPEPNPTTPDSPDSPTDD
jgi:hypothetical protein